MWCEIHLVPWVALPVIWRPATVIWLMWLLELVVWPCKGAAFAQDHDVYKRRLDKDGKVIPDTVTKHEVRICVPKQRAFTLRKLLHKLTRPTEVKSAEVQFSRQGICGYVGRYLHTLVSLCAGRAREEQGPAARGQ